MKLKLLQCLFAAGWFCFIPVFGQSQSCIPVNMNGTVYNIACPLACTDIDFQIPHIKSTTDYRVTTIPYTPYTFTTPGGNEPTEIYNDDLFSHLNNLPFTVCFYGNLYNSFVIGSNGIISFDASQADCDNDFRLDFGPVNPGVPQPIPHVGTASCGTVNVRKYPALAIMGPYHDINPNTTATTPARKVEWRVEGIAPCRKLVVSFFQIALFGDINSINTSQIVVHESTGIIDVFIAAKGLDNNSVPAWNANFAILGLQKDNTTAVAAPGKNCTVWAENNTAYRFVPSGAGSRFVQSELVTLSGTVIGIADTATTTTGLLDVHFANVCPPSGSTDYVIRTTFSSCSNPALQLVSLDTVTFNLSNSLEATAVSTNTDCGPPNGTITVTIPPGYGNPPFSYTLDGATPVSNLRTHTFTGVSVGPHVIDIADATNSCTSSINITVARNNNLLATTSVTAASCSEVYNGTITVGATNGFGPYTYQLDGFLPASGPNPYTFTNVNSGSHIVIVYDATGCQSGIINVDVPANAGVNGNAVSTAATCPTVSNGSITVTALGGTAPYTYQLDGGTPQSGTNVYTFTNVSANIHTVLITDFVGCTRTINITVAAGPPITATNTAIATSCFGAANGSITITPANGVPPFTFSLDGMPPVAGSTPYTFSNLGAGMHNYQVFDNVGCASQIYQVMVNSGPGLSTTVNVTHVLCNGNNTGTITVNPPPLAIAPFDYSLDGITWQSSPQFSGLAANTYSVYFRSVNGCQGLLPVTITEPAALTAVAAITPVRCNGEANGVVTISPSGGVAPYQYSINGGANWQTSNSFIRSAGIHTVLIRDANNCITSRIVTVSQPSVLIAFSSTVNASCDGGNDGRIIVNASGGNAFYQYSIDGINFQTSNLFNVNPGSYTIWVRDNLGCSTFFTTTVGLTVNLFLNPQTDTDMCEGKSVQLQTSSNATMYAWSPRLGLSDTTLANPVANPAITSQYTLIATLGRCTTYDTVIVNVHTAPVPDAGPDGDICYGQSYQLQGTGGFSYTWTPSIYLNTTTGANPISTPTRTTVYTLSIEDAIGCKSLITDDVKVAVKRTMKVNVFPFDTLAHPGTQFQLQAVSPGVTYSWSPAAGLNNANVANPIVTVGAIGDDITYEVVAIDGEGCKAEGYVRIRIYKGPDIYMPTGFTPNGDGLNDRLIPVPVGIASYNYFRVFNRWGQLVFSTKRLNEGWDGKIAGKEQATGTYVWMIEGVTKDNRVISKKGTVSLLR
jgi:gliding motility-associated-like protein